MCEENSNCCVDQRFFFSLWFHTIGFALLTPVQFSTIWRHVPIGTTFLTFFASMENGHCAMVLALADNNYILIFWKNYVLLGRGTDCAEEKFLIAPYCSDWRISFMIDGNHWNFMSCLQVWVTRVVFQELSPWLCYFQMVCSLFLWKSGKTNRNLFCPSAKVG